MRALKLSEIAAPLNGTYNKDAEFCGVCIDTRKITKNCLFVCIKGERFDAHQFAEEALEKGAAAVMVHENVDLSGAYIKVDDTSKALLALGGYYRSLFNIPVVALTGSVGKTTTKEFTSLVVSSKYKTIKTQGNLNNEIGLPQTLFQIDDDTEAAVVEMGMNHFGEIHRLVNATRPTLALITNIGVSHIENLGSREGILKAKLEILDGLSEGAPLIINGDNDMLATVLYNDEICSKYNVISFGIKNKFNYNAENIKEENGLTYFDVVYTASKQIDETDGVKAEVSLCRQKITIPTVGIHNVYNALAAFAVGITLNIEPEKIATALSSYVPTGMRQRLNTVGGRICIEDCYNASPDSMRASLGTLGNMNANKKIAVLGDMLELGDYSKEAHLSVGKMAGENNIDCVLAFGNNAKYYVSAAKENGVKDAVLFDNKTKLSDYLASFAQDGDAVLFKGSRGMKLEDVMNTVYKRWEN
ncbi:UDP-N-acetylmuramoyl-tripeptide--D-alanyl-D-alanine ligase [uncultured Eubacterium sp.]|uniref:UDP-N-acetylmuramoyl-tripeptide--D-alanyl-D- alanine ligase n=1 Tax=uncultured Eubacterium sp. TaxID=165185 RepID=UPI0025DB3A71|nr:UDP-N-acetylmuramoyl-tripeptide--D-alanyl-D-alanine ligase [uncultured Eubacterium sp.]